MTFSARGNVSSVPAKEGITYKLTRSSGNHDRNEKWSPDENYIAYKSDMDGEFEIYLQNKKGKEAPDNSESGHI